MPARKAKVRLQWGQVTIRSPATAQIRHLPAVELYARLLTEVAPPQGTQPLRWVRLATVPIKSRKQALHGLRRLHDIGIGYRLRNGKSIDAIPIGKFVGSARASRLSSPAPAPSPGRWETGTTSLHSESLRDEIFTLG